MGLFTVLHRIITLKVFSQYVLGQSEEDWNNSVLTAGKILGFIFLFAVILIIPLLISNAIIEDKERNEKIKQREEFLNRVVMYHGEQLPIIKKIGGVTYCLEQTKKTPLTDQVYSYTYYSMDFPDSISVASYKEALKKSFDKKTKKEIVETGYHRNEVLYSSYMSELSYSNGYTSQNIFHIETTDLQLKKLVDTENEQLRKEKQAKEDAKKQEEVGKLMASML